MTVIEKLIDYMKGQWFYEEDDRRITCIFLREDNTILYHDNELEFYCVNLHPEYYKEEEIDGFYKTIPFKYFIDFKPLKDVEIVDLLNSNLAKRLLRSKV